MITHWWRFTYSIFCANLSWNRSQSSVYILCLLLALISKAVIVFQLVFITRLILSNPSSKWLPLSLSSKHWCFILLQIPLIVSRELQLKVPWPGSEMGKLDIDASSNNGNLMMLWSWIKLKGVEWDSMPAMLYSMWGLIMSLPPAKKILSFNQQMNMV